MTGERPDVRALARHALTLGDGAPLLVEVTATDSRARRIDGSGVLDEHTVALLEIVVRAHHDGHVAAATADGVEDLGAAVARAVTAARAAAAEHGPGDHPGPAGPQPVRTHDGYDPMTARHDDTAVQQALAAALPEPCRALLSTRVTETGLVASTGLDLHDRTTAAALTVVTTDPVTGRTASATTGAAGVADLDVADVVARVVEALGVGPATPVAAGPLPLVLGPEAVAALLTRLGADALDGRAHAEGRGALAGRLGTRVAAAAINLADSPRFARQLPAAFDRDGVPKAPVPLIQDGVAHRVVHDRHSAARAGATTTGHATGEAGPRPEHLVLIGGGAADLEELIAPVARGLYVSRLAHLDPDGAATALGARHIVDGTLAGPAAACRLDADPLAVLQRTDALTTTQWLVPNGERGGVVCPALRTTGASVLPAAGATPRAS